MFCKVLSDYTRKIYLDLSTNLNAIWYLRRLILVNAAILKQMERPLQWLKNDVCVLLLLPHRAFALGDAYQGLSHDMVGL
jgi:hypothetical protein